MSSEVAPLPIEQENQWVPWQGSANEEVRRYTIKMRETFKRNVRRKKMKGSANRVLKEIREGIRATGGQKCTLESNTQHIIKK
jgi:hypothetical protein